MSKPIIGITTGDPAGVGPEIALKVLQDGELFNWCHPIIFGDYKLLSHCADTLGIKISLEAINCIPANWQDKAYVYDLKNVDLTNFKPGQVSSNCGQAAIDYLKKAISLAKSGNIDAIATCPINKEAVQLFDPGFTGHTELLAAETNTADVTMALISPKLTVTHVTTHVSMAQACELIKEERVLKVINLTYEMMKRIKNNPKVAVAGFNAHAGENGAFGHQEIEEITPAVTTAQSTISKDIFGPLPPDTVFLRAVKGQFDAVVCMYHDQGHIPMKILDFDGAVNVTLGLPIIRTSVDHGTAFDIAWQNKANHNNLKEAVNYACKLAQG